MKRLFLEDFERRRAHVRRYMSVVFSIEHSRALPSGRLDAPLGRLEQDRLHVMRAGAFLVAYNMVEATMRGALDAIHEEMSVRRVRFENLHLRLRREVVSGFKRNADPAKHLSMLDVPVDLVAAALDTEHQFSGNVDARRIREIADVYGFKTTSNTARTRDGIDLLTIKNHRNDLAHGRKTYDEVGRDYPMRDLLGICIRGTRYLDAILTNVDDYLDGKLYLERQPPET